MTNMDNQLNDRWTQSVVKEIDYKDL
uniref:Uncharacterized protein n=1 Tax=Tetranychus urticae TaxID=32264 RepID=T1KT90_TETUR